MESHKKLECVKLGTCIGLALCKIEDPNKCPRIPFDENRLKELKKEKTDDNFWEKAYGQLNIKEALEETFKEMDKEENNE